jgi:hypothetical protein
MVDEITETRQQKFRRLNKDKCNQRTRDWRKNNKNNLELKKKMNETNKEWRKNNPDKCRKQKLNYRRKLRIKVIMALGGKCSNPNCLVIGGCTDIDCLQIDHTNGNGRQDRKLFSSTHKYYKYILESIKLGKKEYQCLCANCNVKKRNNKNQLI